MGLYLRMTKLTEIFWNPFQRAGAAKTEKRLQNFREYETLRLHAEQGVICPWGLGRFDPPFCTVRPCLCLYIINSSCMHVFTYSTPPFGGTNHILMPR